MFYLIHEKSMTLKIYNTLTRRKEEFRPLRQENIGVYVCGITAYDFCHIGHARSAVVFDIIIRYLQYKGYPVQFIKNFTDVDDKIISPANAEGVHIHAIAERYITEHNRDMDELGILKPTQSPKATEYINEIIALIDGLIKKNYAYVADGDVYYSVEAFKEYGRLSGRNLEDMVAGARVDIEVKKRNPMDFALWKSSKEGEPWWDSPWGKGRPGWHIECSAMSLNLLGETFDIHGGGEDLIFPHHENEIAQSQAFSGKIPAHYWIHNGFIKINSEKMSKSLGNVFSIREILKLYHPEVLRLFFLQSHYRSPIDFTDESLADARSGMDRFYSTLAQISPFLVQCEDSVSGELPSKEQKLFEKISELPARFSEAMDDDFNTARALGYIFDLVRILNGYMGEEGFSANPISEQLLKQAYKKILETGNVLGLFCENPEEYFIKDRNRAAIKLGLDLAEIEKKISERTEARASKDWKKADEIRKELARQKIHLMDSQTGTNWRIE
jgi:cysteinyl-tRNA synthetase